MPRARRKNVFCLEEWDWWRNHKQPSTVRPIFDLVAQMKPYPEYIHRGIATREEFEHGLKTWRQRKFASYPILYLAFHGNPRRLCVGDRRRQTRHVELDDIAQMLAGKCKGRFIHFGACSTLDCDRRVLKRFLRITGALAVSGYQGNIDWMQSAAFEVLLMSTMQARAGDLRGAKAIHRDISNIAGKQVRQLGFRIEIARPSRGLAR